MGKVSLQDFLKKLSNNDNILDTDQSCIINVSSKRLDI